MQNPGQFSVQNNTLVLIHLRGFILSKRLSFMCQSKSISRKEFMTASNAALDLASLLFLVNSPIGQALPADASQ
jgi:hypothetical protein